MVRALKLMRIIAESGGPSFSFEGPDETDAMLIDCLATIEEELGDGSELAALLKAGIAIHHGGMPARTKVAIERLIRAGRLRVVVATTTLGQGVNLPIRTVLVRGLQQDQNTRVNPISFWNIAGRAGRAMSENEGHVLFFNDTTRDPAVVRRQRRVTAAMIDRSAIEDVVGVLHRALSIFRQRWKTYAPGIDLATLCLKLAEDDFAWLPPTERSNIRGLFDLIDQHLLAVAMEGGLTPDEPDRLQEILQDSLLFAQLEVRPIADLDDAAAQTVLNARLRSVFRRIPAHGQRVQFYRMGFSLADCQRVVDARDSLLQRISAADSWSEFTESARMGLLLGLAELALTLDAASSAVSSLPANSLSIVEAWLSGKRSLDMLADGLAGAFEEDPARLGRFVEDLCVYGLAWVITGFVGYARQELERGGLALPVVAEHFPAMFKVGVSDPLAAVFAPYVQQDRRLARQLASVCPHDLNELNRAIAWLNAVEAESLLALGVTPDVAVATVRKRRTLPETVSLDRYETVEWTLSLEGHNTGLPAVGDPVWIRERTELGPSHFQVITLRGAPIGVFRLADGRVPEWMFQPHAVEVTVRDVAEGDDARANLVLSIRRLST